MHTYKSSQFTSLGTCIGATRDISSGNCMAQRMAHHSCPFKRFGDLDGQAQNSTPQKNTPVSVVTMCERPRPPGVMNHSPAPQ